MVGEYTPPLLAVTLVRPRGNCTEATTPAAALGPLLVKLTVNLGAVATAASVPAATGAPAEMVVATFATGGMVALMVEEFGAVSLPWPLAVATLLTITALPVAVVAGVKLKVNVLDAPLATEAAVPKSMVLVVVGE